MGIPQRPLSKAQLELLKAFSHDLSEEDLGELQLLLTKFYTERLVKAADEAWDKKGWDADKVESLLTQKLRAKK